MNKVILIVLGIVLAVAFFMLAKSIFEIFATKRRLIEIEQFFTEHKPKKGLFMRCDMIEGEGKLTYEFRGKYKPSKPNYNYTPNTYYTTVIFDGEDGIKYTAVYQISRDDYRGLCRKMKMIDEIEIKPNWQGVEFGKTLE